MARSRVLGANEAEERPSASVTRVPATISRTASISSEASRVSVEAKSPSALARGAQVDGVADARRPRRAPLSPLLEIVDSSGTTRPSASQHRRPARPSRRRCRECQPRPGGQWLGGEEPGGVGQFGEAGAADHPGLGEQRVHAHGRSGCGCRVRGTGALATRRTAADNSQQRLALGEAPGHPGELASVAERFQVQGRRGDLGSSIHAASRSLPETSALLPSETKDASPTPDSRARSSRAMPTPPDCEATARPPGGGNRGGTWR